MKHDCKKNSQNEDEEMVFKDISGEKAKDIKNILLQKSIELCAKDFLSPEIFSGTGFLNYVQYLVAIGEKEGCINLPDLLASKSVICRYIQTFKEEEHQTIEQNFKESTLNQYCSLTMKSNATIDGDIKLTVSVIYFNTDLTELTKKVIFTMSFDDCVEMIMVDERNTLKTFGCDERTLKKINVVTPKKERFTAILGKMCPTRDCVASIINSVLKPFSDNKDIGQIIFTCKAIVSHLMETEKNKKLSFAVVADNGT